MLVEDVLFLGGGGGGLEGFGGVAVMEEGVLGGMMGGGWMGWDGIGSCGCWFMRTEVLAAKRVEGWGC